MKRVTLLVALLLFTAPILIQTALAQSPDSPVGSRSITSLEAANVEAYWTEERMRDAKPLPLPTISGTPAALGAVVGPAAGSPVVATSGRPGATPVELTGAQAERLALGQEPLFGTFPDVYTRYRLFPNLVSIYTTFPHRIVGKLFFRRGATNFVCSGAAVNSTNRAVVWTAGHCVATPGFGFHTNFAFVPARFQGAAPLGIWTVRQPFTLVGWFNLGRFNYDHGALVMNRRNGALIGNVTGFLGFAANLARGQHWHAQGYPAAGRVLAQTPPGAQFDGEHQELCAASFARNDQPGTAADPPTIGIGCDQTGGTSGGPWTKDYSGVAGATNILNGNNSYRYLGGPPNNLRLFSPYFTTGAINLRNAAQAVVVSN